MTWKPTSSNRASNMWGHPLEQVGARQHLCSRQNDLKAHLQAEVLTDKTAAPGPHQ